MNPSSEFCRAQQAVHEAKAAEERLPNARKVAMAAAHAWGREANLAASAERRRALRQVAFEDEAILAEFRAEEVADMKRPTSSPTSLT